MTGRQGNPGAGYNACKEQCCDVYIPELVKGLGINRVRVVEPYQVKETAKVIEEELAAGAGA